MEHIYNQYDINMLKNRIKEIRELRGETQLSLADKLGVQRQAVIGWEKKGIIPSLENLVSLCETLDCSMDYLLGSVDTPEIEPISKASHYSGISSKIIKYGTDHSDYLDCLNFFMNPDNCAEFFNHITLNTWKKYWIESNLAEIHSPLKEKIIKAFDEYIAITPINQVNKNTYKEFLKTRFPKEQLILSSERTKNGLKIKGCFSLITYQNFFDNKEFNYNSFIKYLVDYTFEPLLHNTQIELQKTKLANAFIDLFTKYLEEVE